MITPNLDDGAKAIPFSVLQEVNPMVGRIPLFSLLCTAVATISIWLTISTTVRGDSIVVETCYTRDLVDAINTANANNKDDTILLKGDCTYTLTTIDNTTDGPNGLPLVNSGITILGNGAIIERSGVSETPPFRLLYVTATGRLTLHQVTLRNGRMPDGESRLVV